MPSSGELILHGRVMPASNETFVAELDGLQVVYKPVAGERPLWDFPDGTLALREYAAFLVSQETGWEIVPPTWLGDGPRGPGMLQEWREPADGVAPVDIVTRGQVPVGYRQVFEGVDQHDRPVVLIHEDTAALRKMALFDAIINNADRKGGHVLAMGDGHRFGVDHGVSFHQEPKLRTVLWGWSGERLSAAEQQTLDRLLTALAGPTGTLHEALAPLLAPAELTALARRIEGLLTTGVFPAPDAYGPVIPWPPF